MSSDETIIGIDLGTTNSLVCVFRESGPELIPNALGQFMTPSAVGVSDDSSMLIGQAAKDRLVTHPQLTTARFKRYMGTDHQAKMGKKTWRAEELSALILRALKEDAEAHLGHEVIRAIISVPAYFNDVQRKATMAAARIAGLQVERLVNEPTAAALAYGLQDRDAETTFLVVDLGGGTFDVSILEMFSGVMEVRASSGDAFLGGEDFTDAALKHIAQKAEINIEKLEPEAYSRLRAVVDKMKHRLTETHEASANFHHKKKEYAFTLTRETFEEITAPLTKRIRLPIQRAISDAGLKADQIDRILMVGGATRMDCVRSLITRLFKRFPEHDLNPDHVVALGAGVQAGLAARHEALDDMVMTDVAPFTLGYEVAVEVKTDTFEFGHFSPLIERNTVVPVSRSQIVNPLKQGQDRIELKIYQGEAPFVKDNVKIGELNIEIPPNKKEFEMVDVRYTYDSSGILEVVGKVLSTGKESRVVIEGNPGSMTRDEIEKRLKSLEGLKIHPRDQQENTAFLARLAALYEGLLGDERQLVGRFIQEFEAALHSQDPKLIAECRKELEGPVSRMEAQDVF